MVSRKPESGRNIFLSNDVVVAYAEASLSKESNLTTTPNECPIIFSDFSEVYGVESGPPNYANAPSWCVCMGCVRDQKAARPAHRFRNRWMLLAVHWHKYKRSCWKPKSLYLFRTNVTETMLSDFVTWS